VFAREIFSGARMVVGYHPTAVGTVPGPRANGQLAFGAGVAQRNLSINDLGVNAELCFDGKWHPVRIPWSAMYGIRIERGPDFSDVELVVSR